MFLKLIGIYVLVPVILVSLTLATSAAGRALIAYVAFPVILLIGVFAGFWWERRRS